MEENLKFLKFNLQESQYPYFSDDDLKYLLEQYPDPLEAAYEACLIKAQDDSVKLGPITINNNQDYWLRRANHLAIKLRNERAKKNSRQLSMRRVDEY